MYTPAWPETVREYEPHARYMKRFMPESLSLGERVQLKESGNERIAHFDNNMMDIAMMNHSQCWLASAVFRSQDTFCLPELRGSMLGSASICDSGSAVGSVTSTSNQSTMSFSLSSACRGSLILDAS